ncbi:unnamed protein product [Pleuronectes platessa]|uniref:Uncharacterized protein n=1 Tax=Pleuronectes platessa TaxID=8262 RepID=A0A9N7UJ30_PLEPL|nr:unnamed protein product [Pleuronectes platessa]
MGALRVFIHVAPWESSQEQERFKELWGPEAKVTNPRCCSTQRGTHPRTYCSRWARAFSFSRGPSLHQHFPVAPGGPPGSSTARCGMYTLLSVLWVYPGALPWKVPRKNPHPTPEPPRLASVDTEKQWLNSKPLPDV